MDSRLTIPYEQRLCRLEYRPPTEDPERVVRMLMESHFNLYVSSATVGTGHAFFKSKHRAMHPDSTEDYIPRIIELCHQNNIMIISWVAFNIQDVHEKPEHYQPGQLYPQWIQKYIDETGHKTGTEAGVTGMCMMSTPYREKHGDFVQEIMELGFDGIWFDGYMAFGQPGEAIACVCDCCAEHFKSDIGVDLPEKIDWNNPRFLKFVSWRYDKLIESAHYLEDRIKKVDPDAPVSFNTHSFPKPHIDWRRGTPLRRVRFGASQHTGLGPTNGIQQHPLIAKVAHAQNPEHADTWQPIFTTREIAWLPDQPPNSMTLRLHGMSAITHGVVPWYGGPVTHSNVFKNINDETQRRLPTLAGNDVKYVGVVMSERTKDFYGHRSGPDALVQYRHNLFGIDSMLSQHHLLNGIVFDDDLETGQLEGYRVLILSNTACLSPKALDNLKAWVVQGGTLVATYETSLYDEWGTRRTDFGLGDLFGIRYLETVEEENSDGYHHVDKTSKDKSNTIEQLVQRSLWVDDSSLNDGISNATFYGSFVHFESNSHDVEVKVRTLPKSAGFEGIGTGNVIQNRIEVTQRSLGKGKAIYFGTDIGLAYFRWPEKNTRIILSNLIQRASRPPVEVDAPSIVITAARVQPENQRLVVHLLNFPHTSIRGINVDQRLTVDEVIPIHNIRVTLNDFQACEARAFVQEKQLELEKRLDGSVTTVVDNLDIHEAVVFSLVKK